MAGYHLCFYLFITLLSIAHAYRFRVGGSRGVWKPEPSEDYNHWAGRMRFQVNDTLVFKYKKGEDSVLHVTAEDYQKCSVKKPIARSADGNSVFKFDRSGPFYFIGGKAYNCNHGQKLIAVVLAVRNHRPPSPTPSPALSPGPSPDSPDGEAPRRSSLSSSLWASLAVSAASVIFSSSVILGAVP
ncbi:hypothetical protein M569_03912 [Genlisea aurea]|uniref:Phytocyanin domain-containing protein n=1 Tax=Genlisea aurea TaxID=192259 RepID=S8E528_9LAMI|nr:hypothetical protein M569_03912 [Genlisea aurea]